MSGTSAGFGLKYKGSRDSGTSGSHGSRSHSLLIFQTESGRGSTHLLEFSLIPPIIIYPGEYEKWWCEKFLVKVASLVHTVVVVVENIDDHGNRLNVWYDLVLNLGQVD